MEKEILEFRIPQYAICPLINGDFSGCSKEDILTIEAFIAKTTENYGNAHFMVPDENERNEGFYWSNDIDKLGGDCETLYLFKS